MSGTSHPRLQAPIHHVAGDIRMKPGEQRITVRAGDVLLADSSRAVLVLEGRHPVR